MEEIKYDIYHIRLYYTLEELNNDFIFYFLNKDRMHTILYKSYTKNLNMKIIRKFIKIDDVDQRKITYNSIIKDYNYLIVYKKTNRDY